MRVQVDEVLVLCDACLKTKAVQLQPHGPARVTLPLHVMDELIVNLLHLGDSDVGFTGGGYLRDGVDVHARGAV